MQADHSATRRIDYYGCFHLAEALIKNCFVPFSVILPGKERYGSRFLRDLTVRKRIDFARSSPIISLYAELAGYDDIRIRQAIITYNSLFTGGGSAKNLGHVGLAMAKP